MLPSCSIRLSRPSSALGRLRSASPSASRCCSSMPQSRPRLSHATSISTQTGWLRVAAVMRRRRSYSLLSILGTSSRTTSSITSQNISSREWTASASPWSRTSASRMGWNRASFVLARTAVRISASSPGDRPLAAPVDADAGLPRPPGALRAALAAAAAALSLAVRVERVEKLRQDEAVRLEAELVGDRVLQVVRLVDDQVMVLGQHAVLGRGVGHQQRVVDDDRRGRPRPACAPGRRSSGRPSPSGSGRASSPRSRPTPGSRRSDRTAAAATARPGRRSACAAARPGCGRSRAAHRG